jgi:hypothetical protein
LQVFPATVQAPAFAIKGLASAAGLARSAACWQAGPALEAACQQAVARWRARRRITPAVVWERTYRLAHGVRRCMGKRRGYVGVVPDDCRRATNLAEAFRAVRLALEMCGRRADHLRNVEHAARALMAYTDHDALIARPGHDTILESTQLSRRTLQRSIDTLHELGLLITLEEGTTAWLRKARLKSGQSDPYEHQDNRAEVYRWTVPRWADDLLATETPSAGRPGSTELTGTPSRPSPKERAGRTNTSCRRQPAGSYARARVYQPARPQAAGKPATHSRPSPRPRSPQPWEAYAPQVMAVWQVAMPTELTSLLAEHEAQRLANEIARQLQHRSSAELVDRIRRHWDFWRFKLAAGLVRSPIAIAHRMLRRDFDCPDVRCEDQWQLDLDAPCKACAEIAEDTVRQRQLNHPHQLTTAPSSLMIEPVPGTPPQPPRTLPTPAQSKALSSSKVTSHASQARALLAAASPGARKIIAKVRRPA